MGWDYYGENFDTENRCTITLETTEVVLKINSKEWDYIPNF